MTKNTFEPIRRSDGRWGWRLTAANGNIVANDAGQGYENKQDAIDVGLKVAQGHYAPYKYLEQERLEAMADYATAQLAMADQVEALLPTIREMTPAGQETEVIRLEEAVKLLRLVAGDITKVLNGEELETTVLITGGPTDAQE